LLDGTIDFVVSDHSPCVAELKKLEEGDIMGAWGGISTLGLGLSLLWTEARKRNVPIGTILQWTSQKTANHAGLADRKGKIAAGYDADLIIWDPDAEYIVRFHLSSLHSSERRVRSRKNRFGSKTNSRHMKAWYSPGE
jgi:allantoinase